MRARMTVCLAPGMRSAIRDRIRSTLFDSESAWVRAVIARHFDDQAGLVPVMAPWQNETRSQPLQVWADEPMRRHVRAAAQRSGLSASAWIRAVLSSELLPATPSSSP